jgi:hypothetical protein
MITFTQDMQNFHDSRLKKFYFSCKLTLYAQYEGYWSRNVTVSEESYFCSYFTPMASAGPAAIHVKPRRLSRVLGPAR